MEVTEKDMIVQHSQELKEVTFSLSSKRELRKLLLF